MGHGPQHHRQHHLYCNSTYFHLTKLIWWALSDAALLAGDETGTTLTGIDLLGPPGETKWPNLKCKHKPKIQLEGNFSLITQPGDRLRLPETVCMIPGLPEAPGRTLAQGKEMEGSLDLLLLLLWESVDLRQENTGEEILVRRQRPSCYAVSWVTWQPEHRPLISKCRNNSLVLLQRSLLTWGHKPWQRGPWAPRLSRHFPSSASLCSAVSHRCPPPGSSSCHWKIVPKGDDHAQRTALLNQGKRMKKHAAVRLTGSSQSLCVGAQRQWGLCHTLVVFQLLSQRAGRGGGDRLVSQQGPAQLIDNFGPPMSGNIWVEAWGLQHLDPRSGI